MTNSTIRKIEILNSDTYFTLNNNNINNNNNNNNNKSIFIIIA